MPCALAMERASGLEEDITIPTGRLRQQAILLPWGPSQEREADFWRRLEEGAVECRRPRLSQTFGLLSIRRRPMSRTVTIMVMSSAKELASIFSMIRPRYSLTVRMVIPNSLAISLLRRPETTSFKTSCSRGVNVFIPLRTLSRSTGMQKWMRSIAIPHRGPPVAGQTLQELGLRLA